MNNDSMAFQRLLSDADPRIPTAAIEAYRGEEDNTFPISTCKSSQEPHESRQLRRANGRSVKAAPWYRRFSK